MLPDLAERRALWVRPDLLAWPADRVPGGDPARVTWRLHWSAAGGLAWHGDDLAAEDGRIAALTPDATGLTPDLLAAHPQLAGYLALRLGAASARLVSEVLRAQVAVAALAPGRRRPVVTGVQVPLVLDAVYAEHARRRRHGVTVRGADVELAVWAPTARTVTLLTWAADDRETRPDHARRHAMRRDDDGTWSAVVPQGVGCRYAYEVVVHAPTTGRLETNLVTDPRSVGLSVGARTSLALDLDDPAWAPAQWRDTPSPVLAHPVDSTIYELHVRDFSIGDERVPPEHRGSYLAFADDGHGARHLRALAEAGLDTVHLLPTYDIASIPEGADSRAAGPEPATLAGLDPAGEEQQAAVGRVRDRDGYNWGYDPRHWMVPEGSYCGSDESADGGGRARDFRTMVGALHALGLRVVLDQVYNHTMAAGQDEGSVLDKVVPGYYHRLDEAGRVHTSTCCPNVATEHLMAEQLVVDSVVHWARRYRVDGFRFDLMGHHPRRTMERVREALDALVPEQDGVDGRAVYVYGEGWDFGEVAGDRLFVQAAQGRLGGTGIGCFDDRLRDAVRGGSPGDQDPRHQGVLTGLGTAPNGLPGSDDLDRLAALTDVLQVSLAGALRSIELRDHGGRLVRGEQVAYGGAGAGFADEPAETVGYVDAHDNETLWDALAWKLPRDTPVADRVRVNTLCLATAALGQGPCFWHAGTDLLRSKSLDRDSYDSGDWFNVLDWTGRDNGFGRGLPPAWRNEGGWGLMREVLADATLRPGAADVAAAAAAAQDLLRLRRSTPLFRMRSAAQVRARLGYPVAGTADAVPGVVVQLLDDTGADALDPRWARVLVVLNARSGPVAQRVPSLAGAALGLAPVQAEGSDEVVRQTGWDAAAGVAHVPGRTVAVLVQPRGPA